MEPITIILDIIFVLLCFPLMFMFYMLWRSPGRKFPKPPEEEYVSFTEYAYDLCGRKFKLVTTNYRRSIFILKPDGEYEVSRNNLLNPHRSIYDHKFFPENPLLRKTPNPHINYDELPKNDNAHVCKECIVKSVCKSPCDKVEYLKGVLPDINACNFCGSELNSENFFCKNCSIRDELMYNRIWFSIDKIF